ncbi:MAG TPA: D-glycero-beta-D-manno-heptose 1-phosphate adenylyltransferase [Bacteroidetes bacterium]|nr:D-glycero-beta-D-manno-heptose 1-phosphate adenylyltransferase [Bacteroidota bacterium]
MILSRENISKISTELQEQGKTIVFTNGCFDIIHLGHIYYLSEAKKLGDYLIIGLNTDSSVKKLKGPERPINSEQDRAMVLDALKSVDFVVLFDEDTPLELIREISPNILVKGGDYKADEIVGADFMKQHNGKVMIIPYLQGKSTTKIIEKIK